MYVHETAHDCNTPEGLIAWIQRVSLHEPLTDRFTVKRDNDCTLRFCARCKADRRHYVTLAAASKLTFTGRISAQNFETALPMVFLYTCLQCAAKAYAVIFRFVKDGPDRLTLIPEVIGGPSTLHTPKPVAFYIDQAARSLVAGAHSAAASMYRAALEQLLYEQGYTKGMLHQKIQDLLADVAAGKGPGWAKDLDPDFLTLMKEIGNGSIHPNGGDIAKQEELDEELLRVIGEVMGGLLQLVYEEPMRRAAAKGKLSEAARILKKNPGPGGTP